MSQRVRWPPIVFPPLSMWWLHCLMWSFFRSWWRPPGILRRQGRNLIVHLPTLVPAFSQGWVHSTLRGSYGFGAISLVLEGSYPMCNPDRTLDVMTYYCLCGGQASIVTFGRGCMGGAPTHTFTNNAYLFTQRFAVDPISLLYLVTNTSWLSSELSLSFHIRLKNIKSVHLSIESVEWPRAVIVTAINNFKPISDSPVPLHSFHRLDTVYFWFELGSWFWSTCVQYA